MTNPPPKIRVPVLFRSLVHPADRELILGDLVEEYQNALSSGRSRFVASLRFYVDLVRAGIASRWHMRGVGVGERAAAAHEGIRPRGRSGGVLGDVRIAVRGLVRRPGFALAALLTTGLGLGAAMSMFSVVNAVLLRPLPYADPNQVYLLGTVGPSVDGLIVSHLDVIDLRRESEVFTSVSEWQGATGLMESDHVLERIGGATVPSHFFSLLGVTPHIGRFFTGDDDPDGGAVPVVLSFEFWSTRMGADPEALFRAPPFCSPGCTVVGVTPPGFVDPVAQGARRVVPSFWRLSAMRPSDRPNDRGNLSYWGLARARDGATIETVESELQTFSRELQRRHPDTNRDRRIQVAPAREAIVGSARVTVISLFGAVLLLLVIAAVNVANLLLIRATDRREEMAVRGSLGASRSRLLRQLMTEGMVLGAAGAGLGVVIAFVSSLLIERIPNGWVPMASGSAVDPSTLGFGLIATLGTILLFGLVPGIGVLDTGFGSVARQNSGRVTRSSRMRGALLTIQTALSAILLIGAGLLGKSLWELRTTDTGISVESAHTFRVSFPRSTYPDRGAISRAVAELESRLAALPAVRQVGAIGQLPFQSIANSTNVIPESDEGTLTEEEISVLSRYPIRAVGPAYFETMGMRLLAGRGFTSADVEGSIEVAVIDESLASILFPNSNPIGERVVVRGVTLEIVGMVSSIRLYGPARPAEPMLYTSYSQERQSFMISPASFVVRTNNGVPLNAAELRQLLDRVDPSLALSELRPLADELDRHFGAPRFRTVLVGIFAIAATLLCAIGVAGVVGYGVAQRKREVAIRMALGARKTSISALVVRQSVTLTGVGLLAGVAVAAMLAPKISSLLFSVQPLDVTVFAGVALVVGATSVAAAFVPVRRAMEVEPSAALREGA